MIGNKLKPCPFCGSKPIGPEPTMFSWWVKCEQCAIIMERLDRLEIIDAWNKRV